MAISTVHTIPHPGTRVRSAAKENTKTIRATAGRLLRLDASNLGVEDVFLQLHDKATAVANADVPAFTMFMPAKAIRSITDHKLTNGLQVALSSTSDTYTAVATAAGWFYAETV